MSADSKSQLVSVVIPAYNTENYIAEAVRSVLDQGHRHLEVIVIDDGSTDNSAAVAAGFSDPRVSVHRFPNRGQRVARNRGLALAKGDIVAFLDADDVWDPDKLEAQLPLLADGVVAVGCPLRYLSAAGRVMGSTGEDPTTAANVSRIKDGDLLPFQLSAGIFDKHSCLRVGGFDELLKTSEDLDLISKLAALGIITWVPRPLGSYRLHAGSESSRMVQEQRQYARFVAERAQARIHGLTDPDLNAFICAREPRREIRQAVAAMHFRASGLAAIDSDYSTAVAQMLAAILYSPNYAVRRMLLRARGAYIARRSPARS